MALPRLLSLASVKVASVERLETGDLRLSDLVLDREGIRLEADWIELPSGWLYLQERFFDGWSEASAVRIGQVDIHSTGGRADGEPEVGSVYLPQIHEQVLAGLASIGKWLPPLQLNRLSWSDGGAIRASAASVEYRDRRFNGSISVSPLVGRWQTAVSFGAQAPWRLEFSHSETDLTGTLELRGDRETAELEGRLLRTGSQLDFHATFGDSTWLPVEALARSEEFSIPEIRLPLGGGLFLDSVQWSRLQAKWDGRHYRFDAAGQAALQSPDELREALVFELSGSGDLEALHLDSLTLRPAGADADEVFELTGTADFGAATVAMECSALLGPEWLNTLAGRSLFVEPLEVQAGKLSGAWDSPEVQGDIHTTLQFEATEPIGLSGIFHWDGAGTAGWSGSVRCGGAEITSEVSATIGGDDDSIQLRSLLWSDPEGPELKLESPVEIRWGSETGPFGSSLFFSSFTLRGEASEASAAYDPKAGFEWTLKNISLARIDRWLRVDLPGYYAETIAGTITSFRPFIQGSVECAVEKPVEADTSIRLELNADLGERFIDVKHLAVQFEREDILAGHLRLPLRLRFPGSDSKPLHDITEKGNLSGNLKGQSTPAFSRWLQADTGLRLEQARLDMNLLGDWSQPTGHLYLQVEEVGLGSMFPGLDLPRIQALDVRVQVDKSRVDLQTLNFSLNDSALLGSLQIPVDVLLDSTDPDPMEWLRAASGTICLDQWKMENWLDWMPAYLRRSGRLNGTLTLKPALHLEGTLSFEDFGLRPTETMAAVDQIAGRIRLDERIIQLEEAGARLGGSRVGLSGQIDLTDWAQPRWSFDLSGHNVPIRRTTEMILRSDLNIRLSSEDPGQTPLLSGDLRLRSSTLLLDFDPLAPRLEKGTGMRAPFFRITKEPYADWRFDLTAFGDSFMRVRSPYFKARLSADLRLKGSFAEPELLGSVRTLGGELSFPGVKFELDEGEAYIEPALPNEVQLDFSGIAQKASRVIVMEVSQTLEDPLIQFQSTPPMSQADIVRFLATGSTTGGGVGNFGIYLGKGMLGAGGIDDGLSDRLTVDLGEETTRSGGDTFGARYELSPSWSIEGEYDVYDAYNVDLIWSIFQR